MLFNQHNTTIPFAIKIYNIMSNNVNFSLSSYSQFVPVNVETDTDFQS